MKKLIYFLVIIQQINSYAQLSEGGYPLSYSSKQLKAYAELPHLTLDSLNKDNLKIEDQKSPIPLRYSIVKSVYINIKEVGLKSTFNDTDTVWRYKIYAEGAKSIQLIFKKYVVPSGAKLFIYNEDYSQIYGAFTNKNMEADSSFVLADFKGSSLIIEYSEPNQKEFAGQLIIGSIGQAYRDIFETYSLEVNGYIGVNCPEGKDWQDQKHAVCRITFREGSSSFLCTGSLINNVKKDGTPYFLTASHCISTAAEANSMVAYFNHEQTGCTGSDPIPSEAQSISGSSLLTTYSASDFTLLKLNSTPPANYKPFYAGWDASGAVDNLSIGIHHPEGLSKKISIDDSPDVSFNQTITWDDYTVSPVNSHWQVEFSAGKTAGGSSGSPLFNDQKRIIGQLHGGGDRENFYGKLSYSWTNPTSVYHTLKSYLDPNNTGTITLDGYSPATNTPDPRFYADVSKACLSVPIKFSGYSAFNPNTWKWTFIPATITYLQGTNSSSQNPVVSFDATDTYDVRLTSANSTGKDSTTYANMITAGNSIETTITAINLTDSCLLNFNSLHVVASGATTYQWKLTSSAASFFYISQQNADSATIKMLGTAHPSTSFDLSLGATGTMGTCTDSSGFTLPLLMQTNDDIANALPLAFGTTGPYSNKCASKQTNEPIPPYTSCTGQKSWCNEYNDGTNIVQNSVWFYFTATANQNIRLESQGMDNEMALYSANSASDILNGNYTLLAANDDYSASDPNPVLISVPVTSGQTYWVQVDGSGGGSEGSFTLKLSSANATAITDIKSASLKIYPQPVDDYVILEDANFSAAQHITLEIYTITGAKIYSYSYENLKDTIIRLDTGNWRKGMYMVRLICDDIPTNARIIK
jgi:PKD repeat protein